MKLFRSPITTTSEAKTVTLWQVPERNFQSRMMNLLGNYALIENMEPVFSARMTGNEEAILDECFEEFNNMDRKYFTLNYSMSVGDIVDIDGKKFRCLPNGWREE